MIERRAERWEGAAAADLAARWGLPGVYLYERVGSTNDVARALAEAGAPAGTAVLAEEQVAGRGRGGRPWSSPPGLGVWLSMVLRPEPLAAPGLLPILVGLAAAEALDPFVRPARMALKWPNDLQLVGRKLAGILCEGSWDAGGPGFVVAGIGINVLHAEDDFPPELRDGATSVRIAAGWAPRRADVAGAVAGAVFRRLAAAPAELGGALLEAVAGRDALVGRGVRVTGGEELVGTALGITPGGALLLRTNAGALRTVRSGTVRLDDGAPAAE
ncbi:MAG TPA: biotin--[acetyl-CoA-carboxylase] ligase [Longimicrobium sp.]|nr:biotin--[acetyl-CoA-carboxylase] ligase [Longimicrobium sp.]